MNKLFALIASFVILANVASAQRSAIDKGSWIIGGEAGLVANLGSGGGSTLFVNPMALMFIEQRLSVGASLNFSTGGGFTRFGLVPTAAYFFGDPNAKMYPFAIAGIGLITGEGSTDFVAKAGGGLAFMITRDISIGSSAILNIVGGSTNITLMGNIMVFVW